MPTHNPGAHTGSDLERQQYEKQKLLQLRKGLARLDGMGIDEEEGISAEFKLKRLLGIKLDSQDDIVSKYFKYRQHLADHGFPTDRKAVLNKLVQNLPVGNKTKK